MSALKFENVTIGYGECPVLEKVNATLPKNGIVTLLGKNGAGKTTLIKSILGFNKPIKGSILFNGKLTYNIPQNERAKLFSVVFSRLIKVPNIKVYRLLVMGRIPYHGIEMKLSDKENALIENVMKQTEITDLKHRYCTQLSDGQLQKVLIARALVQDSPIVILDEPTSHLDLNHRFKIFDLVRKLSAETDKTFLISTHEIELALQISDEVWWLENGKLYSGYPEEIAFERRLYEQFTKSNVVYDYSAGRFQFQNQNKKEIWLEENGSEYCYWLKQVLLRFGYEIKKDSNEMVSIVNEKIQHYFPNADSKTFSSLKDYIEFLKFYQ